MESPTIRRDINGNIINKLKKNYHISFNIDNIEIVAVESYKEFNKIDEDQTYIVEDDENDERQNKFDIKDYNPEIIEKTPNTDPNGFSKTKCELF